MWTKFTEVASEKYWLVRALEAEQAPKKLLLRGQILKNQNFYSHSWAANVSSMLHFGRKLSYSCSSCKKIPAPFLR
jgi:hypothetical protein